jgi:hypothetical protein
MSTRPAGMAERGIGKEKMTMNTQTITVKHNRFPGFRRLGLFIGLAIAAAVPLAAPGAASASNSQFDVAQGLPVQVFPETTFRYTTYLTDVTSSPTPSPMTISIDAPVGMLFIDDFTGPGVECKGTTFPATTLTCEVEAGQPVGHPIRVFARVQVEPGAPLGVAHFHLSATGVGPALAEDSRPTEVLASPRGYGIAETDEERLNADGSEASQAGGHPYAVSTTIRFNTTILNGEEGPHVNPAGSTKNVTVDLPAGFVGNPEAMPKCSEEVLNSLNYGLPGAIATAPCPADTQVGTVLLELSNLSRVPVFNVQPHGNRPAEFAFSINGKVIHLFPELRPNDDGIRVRFKNIDNTLTLFGSTLTLWGNPADHGRDALRGFCGGVDVFNPSSGEGCPKAASIPQVAFYTNPTSCGPAGVGLDTPISVESWQGVSDAAVITSHDNNGNPLGITGCSRVPFDPQMNVHETTDNAESPSGLDFNLDVPSDGILNPSGISQAHLKKAVVRLPEGVTLNPSAAEGLGTCSPAQYASEALLTELGEGCPATSLIGSLEIISPLLSEKLTGNLFLAAPYDNPSNSLVALYLVARNVPRGIIVKAAGKVEPDPKTGQIVSTFDNLPQLPFAHFHLHFREGGRAPLVSPPACGTYTTEAALTPWSAADPNNPAPNEVAHVRSSFTVDHGVGGGPCPPAGIPPFKPSFEAGSINNNAGSYSPFNMRLIRSDGEQDMTKFSAILPPGVLGKLAGVSKCPEAAIAAAAAKSGRQELASPSCPANSQIGRISAGAGVGSVLTYVGGKVYLGGPYKGDPLSVVVITPAVAGPFDVGTVIVREALTLNPETAEVEVDGASSDPIPHILAGIPLKLRDLRVYVDRKDFILNPTSCDPSSAKSTLFGSYLDVFSPTDDRPVGLVTRFQAANCLNLGFKPKLSLQLKGGTKRGDHPALRAVLRAREGDANIGAATVTLPSSAFLDQAHIRTICTRVQFAAKSCPPEAIYGYARAFTPLLDEAVEGPVYLRSSNHKLPDLVAALHGLVDVNIVGRIDSKNGGIRSSFETVPDAPVTKFVLHMQGGKKGLVVNSRNLCDRKSRADARFSGQNGKVKDFRPVVGARCGKGKK